ncbi:hypothetical protein KVD89_03460 [Helicobacter pylori]|nr:hypothetical protein KVD89_03460 [Helicobacter pylori]
MKDKSVPNNTIFYYEVEDYLKREAKLNLLAGFENLDLVPFKEITPMIKAIGSTRGTTLLKSSSL